MRNFAKSNLSHNDHPNPIRFEGRGPIPETIHPRGPVCPKKRPPEQTATPAWVKNPIYPGDAGRIPIRQKLKNAARGNGTAL